MIKAIAAVNSFGVIGKDEGLMYQIPKDLEHFKAQTMGHVLVMGRKTYESLPCVLNGRPHIVVTSKPESEIRHPRNSTRESVVFLDAESALVKAQDLAGIRGCDVYVIGGQEIFRLYASEVEELHLTWIMDYGLGDAYFPIDSYRSLFDNAIDGGWFVCEETGLDCRFSIYERLTEGVSLETED